MLYRGDTVVPKLGIMLVLLSAITGLNPAYANDREDTMCGWIKERLMFKIWSSAAPDPDESRIRGKQFIETVSFKTSDKRTLKGYRYRAHNPHAGPIEPKGYILMALGNAMIADQIIDDLMLFSQKGYDVYIYDYRGYGSSEGKRRIKAFIEDYKELVEHLNSQYQRHLLYGVSLGGAVFLNVIGSNVDFDRAVIDSSPSRLSTHGCPKEIDPAENVPDDATNIMFITGGIDPVTGPEMTSELIKLGKQRGATVFEGPDYSHPFMDKEVHVHTERLERVLNFLHLPSE